MIHSNLWELFAVPTECSKLGTSSEKARTITEYKRLLLLSTLQANPGGPGGGLSCSGYGSTRNSQIAHFLLSRSKGTVRGYLRSSYCILMEINSLVATLVVQPLVGIYSYIGSDLANILQHHSK